MACLALASALGLLPFAAALYVKRGSDPVRPTAAGAAFGAASASWAGAMIVLECPATDPLHTLVGHALPIALVVTLGAALGARSLALPHARVGAEPRS